MSLFSREFYGKHGNLLDLEFMDCISSTFRNPELADEHSNCVFVDVPFLWWMEPLQEAWIPHTLMWGMFKLQTLIQKIGLEKCLGRLCYVWHVFQTSLPLILDTTDACTTQDLSILSCCCLNIRVWFAAQLLSRLSHTGIFHPVLLSVVCVIFHYVLVLRDSRVAFRGRVSDSFVTGRLPPYTLSQKRSHPGQNGVTLVCGQVVFGGEEEAGKQPCLMHIPHSLTRERRIEKQKKTVINTKFVSRQCLLPAVFQNRARRAILETLEPVKLWILKNVQGPLSHTSGKRNGFISSALLQSLHDRQLDNTVFHPRGSLVSEGHCIAEKWLGEGDHCLGKMCLTIFSVIPLSIFFHKKRWTDKVSQLCMAGHSPTILFLRFQKNHKSSSGCSLLCDSHTFSRPAINNVECLSSDHKLTWLFWGKKNWMNFCLGKEADSSKSVPCRSCLQKNRTNQYSWILCFERLNIIELIYTPPFFLFLCGICSLQLVCRICIWINIRSFNTHSVQTRKKLFR